MDGTYFTDFSCSFSLAMYPFDRQICEINIVVKDVTEEYIELIKNEADPVNFLGKHALSANTFVHLRVKKLSIGCVDYLGLKMLCMLFVSL